MVHVINRVIQEIKVGGFNGVVIKICKRITQPFSQLSYMMCQLFPIDQHLVVFRTEIDYWDNGWAFYHYLKCQSEDPKWKFIWLVNSTSDYEKTERTRFVSFGPLGFHFLAYYFIARARFIFITHGLGLVPLKKRPGQTTINLCHGCGYKRGKGVSKKLKANYDFAMVVGKFFIAPQSKFLQCESQIILPLGFPRNDLLIQSIGPGSENPFIENLSPRKVLLWMPTYRASKLYKLSETNSDNQTGLPLLDEEQLENFNKFLNEIGAVILLKIHYLQADKETFKRKFSNIIIIKDNDLVMRGLQLYQVVAKTDALITDYSSIAVDYLLTDNPIGFILDDINTYIEDRGFVFDDVKSIMPGSHIYTINDLYEYIKDVVNDNDEHKEWRNKVRKQMYDYADDKSSERIAKYFGMLN